MKPIIYNLVFLLCLNCIKLQAQWQISTLPKEASIRAIDGPSLDNLWISGSNGSIFHSTDGGQSWTNRCPKEYEHLDFRGIAVIGSNTVLAMSAGDASEGKAIVIKTTDGGLTWKKVVEKTEKGIFFDTIKFSSPWTGYLIGDPIDEYPYLLKTIDGGETWTRVENLPLGAEGESSFAASNSCITTLGSQVWFNTQNRVFHSINEGKNWNVYNSLHLKGAAEGIFGIFALDAYTLITVGGDYLDANKKSLQFSYSSTGGKSWYTQNSFWQGGLTECIAQWKNTLIAVGTRGTALSQNGGLDWTWQDQASFHVIKCFDEQCVAAGAKGRIGILKP